MPLMEIKPERGDETSMILTLLVSEMDSALAENLENLPAKIWGKGSQVCRGGREYVCPRVHGALPDLNWNIVFPM
jgi:hypothetical protein